MIFAWFMTVIIPTLATLGAPWLADYLGYTADDVYSDRLRLLIHFFIATAPMLSLAVFSLVDSIDRYAVRFAVIGTGIATLAVWGWYHFSAREFEDLVAGTILLASPIFIGLLGLILYKMRAGKV